MQTLGLMILGIGGVIAFIGWIMLVIAAFSNSVLWGLGSIIFPFVQLIYVILNWYEAKQGFMVYLFGAVLVIVGGVLGFPESL